MAYGVKGNYEIVSCHGSMGDELYIDRERERERERERKRKRERESPYRLTADVEDICMGTGVAPPCSLVRSLLSLDIG